MCDEPAVRRRDGGAAAVRGIRAIACAILLIAAPAAADGPVVIGQASYRERIALSDSAIFEATLLDVSRPDAPAEVLGQVRIEPAGQVPIQFAIPYDPAKIDERHTYAVRARITEDGRLLFTTDTVNPVLTFGHGSRVQLPLVRVRSVGRPEVTADLEETRWILLEINRVAVPARLPQEPHLMLRRESRRVTGTGGCNTLTGVYELDGTRLKIKQLASTRKACLEGMDTEASLHAVLDKVSAFSISGRRLVLLDDGGKTLAVLEAAPLHEP